MSDELLKTTPLFNDIKELILSAKQRATVAVNVELTLLYWQVGTRICTEILQGKRAEYGKQVIVHLAGQLTATYGRGWSQKQLRHCLRFAETFPNQEILYALSAKLSWFHFGVLIGIGAPLKHDFCRCHW